MANSRTTLSTFFRVTGRLGLMARGMAMPMMKRKEGNTRSAQVSPFHRGCISHQTAPYTSSLV